MDRPSKAKEASSPVVWEEFGIYPRASQERKDYDELRSRAVNALSKLPLGNLLLLGQQFNVTVERRDSISQAMAIAGAIGTQTILGLWELQAGRGAAINWTFQQHKRLSTSATAELRNLAGVRETLKPLTKLLLLFNANPKLLRDVYYHHCWVSAKTAARLETPEVDPSAFLKQIQRSVRDLERRIREAVPYGAELTGSALLPDGCLIVVLTRGYRPTVRRDYATQANVLHGCGLLVLGVRKGERRLHVKSAAPEIIQAAEMFLQTQFGGDVIRIENDTPTSFEATRFVERLIDGVPPASGVTVTGVTYRRSKFSNSPIQIKASPFPEPVSRTIASVKATGMLDGLGLLDVTSFNCQFEHHDYEVSLSRNSTGSICFVYSNKGIDDAHQSQFEKAFATEFGLPLLLPLDPRDLPRGTAHVVASLFHGLDEAHESMLQKPVIKQLTELGVIAKKKLIGGQCTKLGCEQRLKFISQIAEGSCARCGNDLTSKTKTLVELQEPSLIRTLLESIGHLDGWDPSSNTASFEKLEYHFATKKGDAGQEIERVIVLMKHHVTKKVREQLTRLAYPVLLLDTHVVDKATGLDDYGNGWISVPLYLESLLDSSKASVFQEQLSVLIGELMRTYRERLDKAARISTQRVRNPEPVVKGREKEKGKEFEVDVYNLIKIIAPFSVRLGREGSREPDGIIALPDFRSIVEDERPRNYLIGYDPKFNATGKGFKLNSYEQSKVSNYAKLYQQGKPMFDGHATRIEAHIIISNHLVPRELSKVNDLLNLSRDTRRGSRTAIRLVGMTTEFLLTVVDFAREYSNEFIQRRPQFYDELIETIYGDPDEPFITLDAKDATDLISRLRLMQVFESRTSAESLKRGFDYANKKLPAPS